MWYTGSEINKYIYINKQIDKNISSEMIIETNWLL